MFSRRYIKTVYSIKKQHPSKVKLINSRKKCMKNFRNKMTPCIVHKLLANVFLVILFNDSLEEK